MIKALYPFQHEGLQFLLEAKRSILADDVGLGKTVQALAVVRKLNLRSVLIVSPKTAQGVWEKHIASFDKGSRTLLIRGKVSLREELLAAWRSACYTLINYELLYVRAGSTYVLNPLLRHHWDAVIFDEAHKLKNRKSRTLFKVARQLAPRAERIHFLTASPVMNHAYDLWPLLYIIDRSKFSSFWRFAETYFQLVFNGFGYTVEDITDPTDSRVVALKKVLEPYVLRRTKKEVFPQMPKVTIEKIWVGLVKKQRRVYQQMEKEFFAELTSGETVSAALAISRLTRLRQIATDPSIMVDDAAETPLRGPKVGALLDIIDSLQGKKFVVFSDSARLLSKLGLLFTGYKIRWTGIFGSQSAQDTSSKVQWFSNGAQCKAVLATIQKGGQSIDLTAASTAIFLTKHWTPALNEQAIGRLARHGQTEPVTIFEILSRKTVEEHVERVLRQKKKVTDLIVDYKRMAEGGKHG